MEKKIVIKVTAEDIKRGIADSCWNCPIALAANRLDKNMSKWNKTRVTETQIIIPGKKKQDLPSTAKDFIERFDLGEKVEPFTFEIEE